MKRLFGFVVILGIAFSFIACKASTKNDNVEPVVIEDSQTERYANEYMEIIITKGGDRAAYYAASEIDHFNLVVDFEDSSIEDLNVNFGPNDAYSFNIFKDCTVSLKVSGFDSSSNRIAYGSKNVSFTVGNDVSVTVAVDMFIKGSTVTVGVEINEPNGNNQTNEIDYTDYTTEGYSVMVKNDSSSNLVCFQNTPSEGNLISGVRAGAKVGLKKNSLFTNSHDFVLFVVKEADYLANKDNLAALKANPFAMLYAYYNADSSADAYMVYTISQYMGGQYYILINNSTKYNVELRQNGLYGDSLAYAGAYTTQTKINMVEGNYEIFPVFRKYSNKIGEIITSYPKYTVDGVDYPVFYTFSLDQGTTAQEFNTAKWFNGDLFSASETPSAAYVSIHNGNSGTGVSLYQGANAPASVTSTGGKTINGGKTLVFEVPMQQLGKVKYSTSAVCSGWRIGTSMKDVDVDTVTLEAGKIYYLEVTGTTFVNIGTEWVKDTTDNTKLKAEVIDYEDE